MAKSKKERRSSIRHMAAEDTLGVLEALERMEQQERTARSDEAEQDDGAEDEAPQRPD